MTSINQLFQSSIVTLLWNRKNDFEVSRIRTTIVGVEDTYVDHMTTNHGSVRQPSVTTMSAQMPVTEMSGGQSSPHPIHY